MSFRISISISSFFPTIVLMLNSIDLIIPLPHTANFILVGRAFPLAELTGRFALSAWFPVTNLSKYNWITQGESIIALLYLAWPTFLPIFVFLGLFVFH